MIRRLALLLFGCAAFWALTAPAWRSYSEDEFTLVFAGAAMALCAVPAALTLVWIDSAVRSDPQQAALIALGGSGVRLFAVLLVAFALFRAVPPFQREVGFLVWLVVCYLFTLALEIVLVVRARSGPDVPA